MPSTARARILTARMRSVSGEKRRRRRAARGRAAGRSLLLPPASEPVRSPIAVAVSDTIKRLDLRELGVDDLELLAQSLDVTVDCPIVDIDVLAIGRVHQLVAALDVTGAGGERFEDEELGHRQLDGQAVPGAEVA